jgi:hypothetical protein
LNTRGPGWRAELVADLVADDRRERDGDEQQPQRHVEGACATSSPAAEQQGVTGQEEADQQAGLDEDDGEDGEARPGRRELRCDPLGPERQDVRGGEHAPRLRAREEAGYVPQVNERLVVVGGDAAA